MPTPRRFAFLIHPRVQLAQDIGDLFWSPLRHIPDSFYAALLRRLPLSPIVSGQIRLGEAAIGDLITVPLGARQLLELPRREVQARIAQAVDCAVRRGAEVVGLGALTAPVTLGGKTLEGRNDVAITNGNAFTAAMTLLGVERILNRLRPDATVAVVGASGSVGECLVHLLAQRQSTPRLLLVARHLERLEKLAARVRGPEQSVEASVDLGRVREADLVVLLTAAADAVLGSEHLGEGAWVLDDTQPRNTDPRLRLERPDVTVVDGGMVEMRGMQMRGTIGLGRDLVYACLAETALLALEGQRGHFGIGNPTLSQAAYMLELAQKHRAFGFGLAPFRSFGNLLEPQVPVPTPSLGVIG